MLRFFAGVLAVTLGAVLAGAALLWTAAAIGTETGAGPERSGGATDIVTARAFRLVGGDGRVRAVLEMSGDVPVLTMLDPGGEPVVVLSGAAVAPGLRLRPGGDDRAWLGVSAGGRGYLMVGDGPRRRYVMPPVPAPPARPVRER